MRIKSIDKKKKFSLVFIAVVFLAIGIALAKGRSNYEMDWPMFRYDICRSGFYGNGTGPLGVYIGSDDWNFYKIDGTNGELLDSFTTTGPIHTSPSVADIDEDPHLEIMFYDWDHDISGTMIFLVLLGV